MKIFAILFVIFVFLAPMLAYKIKRRFSLLGYEMASNPMASMLNVSSFWREARKANEKYNDVVIKRYIVAWNIWWVVIVVVIVFAFLDKK